MAIRIDEICEAELQRMHEAAGLSFTPDLNAKQGAKVYRWNGDNYSLEQLMAAMKYFKDDVTMPKQRTKQNLCDALNKDRSRTYCLPQRTLDKLIEKPNEPLTDDDLWFRAGDRRTISDLSMDELKKEEDREYRRSLDQFDSDSGIPVNDSEPEEDCDDECEDESEDDDESEDESEDQKRPQDEFRGENGRALFFKQIEAIYYKPPAVERFENATAAKLHALAQTALSNTTCSGATIQFAPLQEKLARIRGGKGEVSEASDFAEWHLVNALWNKHGMCDHDLAFRYYRSGLKLLRAQVKKSTWEKTTLQNRDKIDSQLLLFVLGVGRLLLLRKRTREATDFFAQEHTAWPNRRDSFGVLCLMLELFPSTLSYEALRNFLHSQYVSKLFSPNCESDESKLLLVAQSFTDFVLQKDNIRGPSNGFRTRDNISADFTLVDYEGNTIGWSLALSCWALSLLEFGLSLGVLHDAPPFVMNFVHTLYKNKPFKAWFQKHVMTNYVLHLVTRDSVRNITPVEEAVLASSYPLFTEFGEREPSFIEICAHSPIKERLVPFLIGRRAKIDMPGHIPCLTIYLKRGCSPQVVRYLVDAGAKVMLVESHIDCPLHYAVKNCLWPQAEILIRAATGQIRAESDSRQILIVNDFNLADFNLGKVDTVDPAAKKCADLLMQAFSSSTAKSFLRMALDGTTKRTTAESANDPEPTDPSRLAHLKHAPRPADAPYDPTATPDPSPSAAGTGAGVTKAIRPKKACARCGVSGKLLKCGRCRGVSYCSQDCQRADWARHKLECNQGSAA